MLKSLQITTSLALLSSIQISATVFDKRKITATYKQDYFEKRRFVNKKVPFRGPQIKAKLRAIRDCFGIKEVVLELLKPAGAIPLKAGTPLLIARKTFFWLRHFSSR